MGSFRDHDNPWLFPLIAWIAMTVPLAASTAKRIDWSHDALWKALALVLLSPIAAAILIFVVAGAFLCVLWLAEFLRRRR